MKEFLLLAGFLSLTYTSISQTVLYQDDFESYVTGSYMAIDISSFPSGIYFLRARSWDGMSLKTMTFIKP
jgi:hypothetical protein